MAGIITGLLMLIPGPAAGDIIFFKDGMKTVCQHRAWEENNEIKCEYDGGILIYRKEDVAHIQKIVPTETVEVPAADTGSSGEDQEPLSTPSSGTAPGSDGTPFYDPRRPYKYWSSLSSKHRTYQEAIDALAAEFNRPTASIEEQINGTNNLEEIRARLTGASAQAPQAAVQSGQAQLVAAGIEFYNPRREFKYWISESGKYHTYQEAIDALAREFGRSAQWIEAHMGAGNDLALIRKNLRKSKQEAGGS